MNFKRWYLAVFCVTLFACSKGGSGTTTPPASTLPAASINNISANRNGAGSVFQFSVALSSAAVGDVTLHYATQPGTALENADFTAATGTLTIASGKTSGTIDVQIKGDSLRKENQVFYVQLDAPKNCTIKTSKGTGTIVNVNGLYLPVDNTGYTTPLTYAGYNLAWADEFSTNSINAANWTFETGGGGWGNNELENYTDRTQNAFASQGNLIIEARPEVYNGNQYTSARMITKNKQVFKYGRVDIRAKLPSTKGIWPALWMLGNNIDQVSWPSCGEIDILELLGQEPNRIYGTIHWGSNLATHASKGTNYLLPSGSFDQQFHVYSMIWAENSIKILVDDQEYLSATNVDVSGTYPFNNNFFFIFNIAVGGNWPGSPDATTTFPQRMIVDYIRVFQ